MRRAGLARRLAALEEKLVVGTIAFVLENGRTVHIDILDVIKLFGEGARWLEGSWGSDEPGDEGGTPVRFDVPPLNPPSPGLELLGRAVSSPDTSMLVTSAIQLARHARERREAIPGEVLP